MKALLVSVDYEEGGLAVVVVNGMTLHAMDCLGYATSANAYPKAGELFDVRFTCLFDDDENQDWDSVFKNNLSEDLGMERLGLWSYRAFGRIVEVDGPNGEARADCGGCLLPLPIEVSSTDSIGAYVSFTILRLDVWRV